MKGSKLAINRFREFNEYDDEFKQKVISSILDEQEVNKEALSISCNKHYINAYQFKECIEKHPVLLERYDAIQYRVGTLSEADIVKKSINTLNNIMSRTHQEKIEQRWDDSKNVWVDVKRTKYPNTDNQITISKFLLEKLHNDFNGKLKEIRLQSSMDILKELSKNSTFTTNEAKQIEKGIANYLRSNGLNLPTDSIEDIDSDDM